MSGSTGSDGEAAHGNAKQHHVGCPIMAPTQENRGRGPLRTLAVVGVVAAVSIMALIALDADPVPIFWALTAGLPLIAFVAIIIVVVTRRLASSAGQRDDH